MFGCISFTAVAFVFQACYGTMDDRFYDVRFTGTVRSKTTNLPIKGIKVLVDIGIYGYEYNFGMTNEKGEFDFYADVPDGHFDYGYSVDSLFYPDAVMVHFLDIDSLENGWFADDAIMVTPAHKNEVKIFVELEEKQ